MEVERDVVRKAILVCHAKVFGVLYDINEAERILNESKMTGFTF